MTVVSVEKSKGRYQVTTEDETITCHPDVISTYRIRPGVSYDDESWQKMMDESSYLLCYDQAIKKLARPQTILGMKTYLIEHNYPDKIVRQVISRLIDKHYLDDLAYAKNYVLIKKHLQGPSMIHFKLKEKGVAESIISEVLGHMDETEILQRLIPNKLSSIKNKSKKLAMQAVKRTFLSKGFSLEAIESVLMKSHTSYQSDEKELIEKSYQKIYRTTGKNKSGYALYQALYQKLYAKGFEHKLIKEALDQHHIDKG